ncbi:DUF5313 family protein [Jatrophihabitans sp.]|uniref:DUF5313 family protein n=1 Tax=Jatrophihabitans sp. TaxID=1932789 RepID=UPI002C6F4160|nr:DUF5313 family protein [Jatrophihabitans sp.]
MDGGTPRRRPSAGQWLWYSVGGRLPADLSEWVLHDTTCRTWALRQVARSLLAISPPDPGAAVRGAGPVVD